MIRLYVIKKRTHVVCIANKMLRWATGTVYKHESIARYISNTPLRVKATRAPARARRQFDSQKEAKLDALLNDWETNCDFLNYIYYLKHL